MVNNKNLQALFFDFCRLGNEFVNQSIIFGDKMDLRVKKTRASIKKAFIELRAQKSLEKITVKEISERAMINKATFYTHYKDIYDLQEQLEDEVVVNVIKQMPHPEYLYTDPKEGTKELARGMVAMLETFNAVFKHGREHYLSDKIDRHIKEFIYAQYPHFRDNVKINALLTILTYGGFTAHIRYSTSPNEDVIDVIGDVNDRLKDLYDQYKE